MPQNCESLPIYRCSAPGQLAGGDAHVWLAAEDGLPEEDLARMSEMLSVAEHGRLERLRFFKDKRLFIASRVHLRGVLSMYAPVEPKDWAFQVTTSGRPYIQHPLHGANLFFSLSHTAGLIAVAVSRLPQVGIDVEEVSRELDLKNIAQSALTASERQRLANLPEVDYRQAFFELWTLKEAYVKARGLGMSLAPDRISFEVEPNRICLSADLNPAGLLDPEAWRFRLFRPTPKHQMALALHGEQGEEIVRWCDF
jgi:4'-phosphopantetheinyl transferase